MFMQCRWLEHRLEVKRIVFAREEGRCFWCEQFVTFKNGTLDHIILKSKGGPTEPSNIVFSCGPCNHDRGDTDAFEFLCSRYAAQPATVDKTSPSNSYQCVG